MTDDELRDELAATLNRCTCPTGPAFEGPQRDCPSHGTPYAQADALLPVVRQFADAQVATERERIACAIDQRGRRLGEYDQEVLNEAASIARGGQP